MSVLFYIFILIQLPIAFYLVQPVVLLVIHYLKNVGWAKWVAEDEFRFLRPFHRMLNKCLELAEQSGKAKSEASPIQDSGLNPAKESEDDANA